MLDRCGDGRLTFLSVSRIAHSKELTETARRQTEEFALNGCHPPRCPQPMERQRARFAFVIKYLPAVN